MTASKFLFKTTAASRPTKTKPFCCSSTKSGFFAASIIWEGHKAGRHIGYSHIEKLHNLSHPRVKYLIGSSTDPEIFGDIRTMARSCKGPVLVILDSDHSAQHVAAELDPFRWMFAIGGLLIAVVLVAPAGVVNVLMSKVELLRERNVVMDRRFRSRFRRS
ncbi:MAG: hypothetical protein HC794_08340 [Nitrospiraceae bacterium]|nr:hypothetical protein [Nitrospiraceae bacterium]